MEHQPRIGRGLGRSWGAGARPTPRVRLAAVPARCSAPVVPDLRRSNSNGNRNGNGNSRPGARPAPRRRRQRRASPDRAHPRSRARLPGAGRGKTKAEASNQRAGVTRQDRRGGLRRTRLGARPAPRLPPARKYLSPGRPRMKQKRAKPASRPQVPAVKRAGPALHRPEEQRPGRFPRAPGPQKPQPAHPRGNRNHPAAPGKPGAGEPNSTAEPGWNPLTWSGQANQPPTRSGRPMRNRTANEGDRHGRGNRSNTAK
jgi:hypothetical protein